MDTVEAVEWDMIVPAGSWYSRYIELRHPVPEGSPAGTVGALIDLTATGYTARMVVATRSDGTGTVLADLADGEVFRRTSTGRLYFEPPVAITSAWVWRFGYHQVELTMPDLTKPVRVATGRVRVSPELVLGPA